MTRGYVSALHSLPGSAGYRLLHPRLVMYDLCGFSRPLRRPASPVHPIFAFVVKLGCCKPEDSPPYTVESIHIYTVYKRETGVMAARL